MVPKKEVVEYKISKRLAHHLKSYGNHHYIWVVDNGDKQQIARAFEDVGNLKKTPAFTYQELIEMMSYNSPRIYAGPDPGAKGDTPKELLWYATSGYDKYAIERIYRGCKYPLKALSRLLLKGIEEEFYKVDYYKMPGSDQDFPIIKELYEGKWIPKLR